jgi:hypothetical protein
MSRERASLWIDWSGASRRTSARGIQRWSCRAGAGRPGWAARCRRAWEERQIDRPGLRGRKRARETVLTGRFRFASVEE